MNAGSKGARRVVTRAEGVRSGNGVRDGYVDRQY